MQDGIIKNTGDSRYLKSVSDFLTRYPDYTAFARALVEGSLPIDLNGINTAGWSTLGTPLDKAALLTDSTEAAIWGSAANRTVDEALRAISPGKSLLKLVQKYTTAGSYTWTCPEDGEYIALIVGGGGSGGVRVHSETYIVTGGGSGFALVYRGSHKAGTGYPVVVGAGGESVSVGTSAGRTDGKSGGSSSFGGITAYGGLGGEGGYYEEGKFGGTSSTAQVAAYANYTGTNGTQALPYGGMRIIREKSSNSSGSYGSFGYEIFADETGLPATMLCAGGNSNSQISGNCINTLPNGKKGSLGARNSSGSATASKGTDVGAGGGGAYATVNYTAKSAAGCDGGVFIYKLP